MEISVTRKLEFDAGHRVMNHESKCATLHGHRYVVEITAEAQSLDNVGRIIDFSVLKDKIGTWLDTNWDHNVIIYDKDSDTLKALRWIPRKKEPWAAPWNPTAENMARHLLIVVCPTELKGTGVMVTKVRVHETPNCYADAVLNQELKDVLQRQVKNEQLELK
jgi:6-pyruvoyltetrahydropterin/6-carboxytetrahydropterin synthase